MLETEFILSETLVNKDWEIDKLSLTTLLVSTFEVVPKTTVSFVTNKSGLSNVFSTATASFAKTLVSVATTPPKTAPVAAIPFIISNPVIEWLSLSSTTSVMTWVVSTPPLITLNKPKREVEALNQCLPDLINL